MRFIVIGAGAVGGVVGARLAQHGHEVLLVARGEHGAAIARDGLQVHDPIGSATVHIDVAASVRDVAVRPDDVVLLVVKSQDTIGALDELVAAAGPDVPVVCVQNGVHNEPEALRRFRRVYGAIIMCPTAHLEPGHVIAYSHPTTGAIDVGRFPTGVDDVAERTASALASSTFSSHAIGDVERWKWAKLLTNLGNAIEAVCGPPARQGPLGAIVRAEGEAVLAGAGIEYASAGEDHARRGDHLQLHEVEGVSRPGGSSWQSLARRSGAIETDYINGEIVMLGRRFGIPTPANEALQMHARHQAITRTAPGTVTEESLLASL